MLFHITGTHSPENCSAHRPERLQAFARSVEIAQELGGEVVGSYSNTLEHTLYLVIKADNAEILEKAFDPVLEYGHFKVTPVTDALETLKRMRAEK